MTSRHRHVAISIATLALISACTSTAVRAPRDSARSATTDQLVRLRCALDGREVVTSWTGDVYAFVPAERPIRLFAVVGMNVARCVRVDTRWYLTSRELMYYLDPASGQRLDRWKNPWTAQIVPVVHVANRLVQNRLEGPVAMIVADGLATLSFDVPLFYSNQLATQDATRPFSPTADYQAGEFFTFITPVAALDDATTASASALAFAWHRVGPWLPWMAMGDRAGHLVYSARGRKVHGITDLPTLLRDELIRLPLYQTPPRCHVAGPNETSWTYFARHLAEYRTGVPFPLPAPIDPDECGAGSR